MLRLGTRASALARWQADWVATRLAETGIDVQLVPITTQGDAQQQGPIGAIGVQGVFTKEIQRALLENEIDLAVHSLKDLPTEVVPGLSLSAVPKRGPIGDVLVSRDDHDFEALPEGAVLGTGSARRQAQLGRARPDLVMQDIRGNVDTRLRKLDDGECDALVLAEAGLRRLGLEDRITQVLPRSIILPAVGQGALGLETREDDTETRDALATLDHADTHAAVVAERAMLAALRGGCLAPVGAWGRIESGQLQLNGVVLSADGKQQVTASDTSPPEDAAAMGGRVGENLLEQGAGELINAARRGAE